jgi:hypothetical protein
MYRELIMNPPNIEPYKPNILICETNTITIYLEGCVIVIDKRTGKVIHVIPEHPILKPVAEAFNSASSLLNYALNHDEVEVQLQTAKLTVLITEIITAEIGSIQKTIE